MVSVIAEPLWKWTPRPLGAFLANHAAISLIIPASGSQEISFRES